MTKEAQAMVNRSMGESFEEKVRQEAKRHGYYVQKMPDRVGFDYLIGHGSCMHMGMLNYNGFLAVECKCVVSGVLGAAVFTPIELRVAEEMYRNECDYCVAVPFVDDIALIPWSVLRESLLNGRRYTVRAPQAAYVWLRHREGELK